MHVHRKSDRMCRRAYVHVLYVYMYAHMCASGVLVCVLIQSDTQLTKGVKINALFSFTLLSSIKSIHWFEVD